MSFKSWILGRVQRMNGLVGRGDLPDGYPQFEPGLDSPRDGAPRPGTEGRTQAPESPLSSAAHLGAYAGLVGAIRDELEHFVASQVRLHLAIAERDRYLLTSIGVRCPGAAETRALLQQFMQEFKPEQVKRYLAREVIAGLPNVAAIDLSQFSGLFDADLRDDADQAGQGGEYRELLAALRSTPAAAAAYRYQVSIVGRWAEYDLTRPAAPVPAPPGATPGTPLAGQRCEFEVEDADGRRRVVLPAVVPGRRYVLGKGEGSDIRVNGSYASRRHAEVWYDKGCWWVTDAGSTNGIRVESPSGHLERSGATASASVGLQPIPLAEGARIVLSARAEGPAADYPWVAIRSPVGVAARITPIAAAGSPKTPLTAILPAQPAQTALRIGAALGSGVRTLDLHPAALPVTVGRSRNQTLVIDRRHEGVSGHHLDIAELDAAWAMVVVHGDNGVMVEGVPHAAGTRFRWNLGETMVLGASLHEQPTCSLTLERQGQD